MYLSDTDFIRYIEAFHSTIEKTAKEFLSSKLQNEVLHISLLPANIIGYLSTQYGIAIEYVPSEKTNISIHRGSARIEDLLVQAPNRLSKTVPLVLNSGKNNLFHDCSFSGQFPFRLEGHDASMFLYNVEFSYGNWKRKLNYAEIYADRSRNVWGIENAVSRAKDEILSALVESSRAAEKSVSIAEYISNYKEKTVLILGDYSEEGFKRINAISKHLSEIGYDPIMIKDIQDNIYQDLSQKVVAIASIARFVVIDDSSKSGHIKEIGYCEQNHWLTIIMREQGGNNSWMTLGLSEHSKDILEKTYCSENLKSVLDASVQWAETKLVNLKSRFSNLYPWRSQATDVRNIANVGDYKTN